MGYYDGTKLLSLKDANGKQPEIYLCCSNRSAGKTTFFGRWFVNRFLKHGEKFILLYRYNYELCDVAGKFFGELGSLFFQGMAMESKTRAKGVYAELFLDEKSCGYALSINNADQIKKMSHLFADAWRVLFDEFQLESNHYCDNEIEKFISIHTSIARGQGKQVKYLPFYLLGNYVTILNPYFYALGISDRLRLDTNFMRGDGWVLEQGFNDTASQMQKESAFNRAFSQEDYTRYNTEKFYLNDQYAFVERPTGIGKYLCTLIYGNKMYGLREFKDAGIIYCDTSADESFPVKLCVTAEDHNVNYLMLRKNDMFINMLRWYFEHGAFRFKNMECKKAILDICVYR